MSKPATRDSIGTQIDSGMATHALDSMQVMIRALDGTIVYWAQGAADFYGYDAAQAVGQLSHEFLATKFPAPLSEIDDELRSAGRWSGDLLRTHRDGRELSVAAQWTLLPARGEAAPLVSELSNDIALRRQSEANNAFLARIVESSDDAIFCKTLDSIVTSWNPAAEKMFGYKASEIVGRPVAILFPPELVDEEAAIIAQLKHGTKIEHFETRRRHKDGTDVFVSLSISPIRDSSGEIVGASKMARDITQRIQAGAKLDGLQAELIHLSRWNTMGMMASSIAHELNQPLAALTNYLSALRRMIDAPQPDLKFAGDVAQKAILQGQRAARIVKQLREMVAKGRSERRIQEIGDMVREAAELTAAAANRHGAHVKVNCPRPGALVCADRVQIQQVLVNLIRNAAEAMEKCPVREVTISVAEEEHGVQIDVADTGPGLPAAVMERLFEPFVTTKESGMGMGLSICHQILESHGGKFWVSPNGQQGTIFSFTIPAEVPAVWRDRNTGASGGSRNS